LAEGVQDKYYYELSSKVPKVKQLTVSPKLDIMHKQQALLMKERITQEDNFVTYSVVWFQQKETARNSNIMLISGMNF